LVPQEAKEETQRLRGLNAFSGFGQKRSAIHSIADEIEMRDPECELDDSNHTH
jgi:hypothetical protein